MVRILPSTQRSRVQSFSQFLLPINEMDEILKIKKYNIEHVNNLKKLVALKKQLPRGKEN
jgi:hypothetical protein